MEFDFPVPWPPGQRRPGAAECAQVRRRCSVPRPRAAQRGAHGHCAPGPRGARTAGRHGARWSCPAGTADAPPTPPSPGASDPAPLPAPLAARPGRAGRRRVDARRPARPEHPRVPPAAHRAGALWRALCCGAGAAGGARRAQGCGRCSWHRHTPRRGHGAPVLVQAAARGSPTARTRAHTLHNHTHTHAPPGAPPLRPCPPQGLAAPITDIERLAAREQRLLLAQPCAGSGAVLGGLKVGVKKLFMRRVRPHARTPDDSPSTRGRAHSCAPAVRTAAHTRPPATRTAPRVRTGQCTLAAQKGGRPAHPPRPQPHRQGTPAAALGGPRRAAAPCAHRPRAPAAPPLARTGHRRAC